MELTRSIPQGDQGPGYGSWEINTALQQEIEGNYSNGSPVAINPANTRSMISTPSQWQSDGITRGEVESHSLYGDGLYRRGEDRPVVVMLTPPMEPAMGPPPKPDADRQPNTPGYGDNNLSAIDLDSQRSGYKVTMVDQFLAAPGEELMPSLQKPKTLKPSRGTFLGVSLMGKGPQRNVPRMPVL